jgi:hypothetical protein
MAVQLTPALLCTEHDRRQRDRLSVPIILRHKSVLLHLEDGDSKLLHNTSNYLLTTLYHITQKTAVTRT